MNESVLQVVIQAGALGLALAILWMLFLERKNLNKSIQSERKSQNDALAKIIERDIASRETNTVALTSLTDSMSTLNFGCIRVQEKQAQVLADSLHLYDEIAKTLEGSRRLLEKDRTRP